MKGRVGGLIALGAGFHPHMTGRENIYLNGVILGMRKQEIDQKFDDIVEFAGIGDFLDAPVSTYSSGMKVRLGFAIASQIKPDVLLIDEVLAVGDMGFKIKCLNAINKIMKDTAVIFVSHSIPHILRISTKVMLLEKGKIVFYNHDVKAGVDKYASLVNKVTEPQLAGSGKARVSEIKVNSSNSFSSQIPLLNYGDDLKIFMKISLAKDIEQAAVAAVICNEDLRPIIYIVDKNMDTFLLQNINREQTIKLTLHGIRLNTGRHFLTIAMVDPVSGEVLTRVQNVGEFQVSSICATWAHEIWKGQWEILE